MVDGNSILMFTVNSIIPFLVGAIGVGLYYRSKLTEILNELADKKAIIAAVINHSEEQERAKVKRVVKSKPVVEQKIVKRKTTKK